MAENTSSKKSIEEFGGRLDRLIVECFEDTPLTYNESVNLVCDAKK